MSFRSHALKNESRIRYILKKKEKKKEKSENKFGEISNFKFFMKSIKSVEKKKVLEKNDEN